MTESQPKPGRREPLRPVFFLMIVLAGLIVINGISKWRMPPELVPWKSDLAAAQAESRAKNKPIFLYFTADWCGPCQMMRRDVWSDSRVAAAADAYVPVRIDIDQQAKLATQYGVESVPLMLVIDADNQIVRRIDHAVEADAMIQWLKRDQPTTAAARGD